MTSRRSTWRDTYKVHPAADVFPMMSDEKLAQLGEDIKANGLNVPLSFCWIEVGTPAARRVLIDGRNRLEAMERVGIRLRVRNSGLPESLHGKETANTIDGDPVALIIGLNIHRRHLTKQQQADLIVAAVKAGEKLAQVEPVSKGGRGKKNAVKAKALEINSALPKEQQVSEPTIKRAIAKAEGRIPQPKTIVGPKLKLKPKLETHTGIDAARRYYLDLCVDPAVDLDAEQEIIIDGLREIAGKRAMQAQADDDLGDIPEGLDRRRQGGAP